MIASDTDEKGQVYDIIFKHKSEISRIELSAGHNRVAASMGGLDEVETAKILYVSNITERLSWSLNINGERRHPTLITNVNSDQDYSLLNASPAVYYNLSSNWSISFNYRYSEKDYDHEDQSRISNIFAFTMSWREPKLLSTN